MSKTILKIPQYEPDNREGRFYYCVNCGYRGDFGFDRHRNVKCEKCQYEILSMMNLEDWMEELRERPYVFKEKYPDLNSVDELEDLLK